MNSQPSFLLANLISFAGMLRQAGLSISLEQTMDAARALEWIDLGNREQFYHALRSLLINRKEDLLLFNQLFNLFWRLPRTAGPSRGQKMPVAPRHNLQPKQHTIATLMAERSRPSDPEVEVSDRAGSFSDIEVLQSKDFSHMTPAELETIKKLIQSMQWRVSRRQTRRLVLDRQGRQLNLRQVMRSCAKHGGVPWQLYWNTRKIKPRPIVVLADISGSMEKYARLLLQFSYSIARGLTHVECFVFGTRLSYITPQLRLKNVDRAVSEAAKQVLDWSGGTRIGESLQTFNRHWGRRMLRRGVIVLIISDGWERGDVSVLQREMRYLQHRCHRLIWLNPLLGNTAYQPLVEGMAAARPFIDDFLPIHNLQSLEALGEHLASLG